MLEPREVWELAQSPSANKVLKSRFEPRKRGFQAILVTLRSATWVGRCDLRPVTAASRGFFSTHDRVVPDCGIIRAHVTRPESPRHMPSSAFLPAPSDASWRLDGAGLALGALAEVVAAGVVFGRLGEQRGAPVF